MAKKLKAEEEERLCILAEPMQKYLAKYVLPTLTQALIEVAELRPEDPIDFLVSKHTHTHHCVCYIFISVYILA